MNRTCTDCGGQFIRETMMIEGVDLLDHITICEPCSDKARAAYEKSEWQRTAKKRWIEAIPEKYRRTDITHTGYQAQIATHKLAMKWFRSASDEARRPFFGMVGVSGLCKSRIASQVAKNGIWERGFWHWCSGSRFQWASQNQFGDDSKEAGSLLRRWREAKNLIFDDIGFLKGTEIVSDTLYDLLEYRSANYMPMIWTSNEGADKLLSKGNLTDLERARNISRLKGYSEIIEL